MKNKLEDIEHEFYRKCVLANCIDKFSDLYEAKLLDAARNNVNVEDIIEYVITDMKFNQFSEFHEDLLRIAYMRLTGEIISINK